MRKKTVVVKLTKDWLRCDVKRESIFYYLNCNPIFTRFECPMKKDTFLLSAKCIHFEGGKLSLKILIFSLRHTCTYEPGAKEIKVK